MTVLSAAQAAEKYGVPSANAGSEFAKNSYAGDPKVRSYMEGTRTTSANKTAWDNQNPGVIGSLQKFDSAPTMAQPGA
jgi:hypothetical protein